MYHDIIKERGRKSVWFDCTVEELKQHIEFLKKEGAVPISLDQLYKHLNQGAPVPDKAIVLTFDDNYQGFYDNAYPLLKELKWPAAMFVHTNFVGDKKNDHPKMTWETLMQLDKEGLVTIGSHTLSHRRLADITPEEQQEEITKSKSILEGKLGHPIPYFAYPEGSNNETTQKLTRAAGYTMSFTIVNGAAEESPNIVAVNRYLHTKIEKAWANARQKTVDVPAAIVEMEYKPSPVKLIVGEFAGVKMGLTTGGLPTTVHSPGRTSVGDFVADQKGVAGINGTFFADAHVNGTDNKLIGPSQVPAENIYVPDDTPERLPRLVNRPMIVWGPKKVAIFPFQPGTMNSPDAIKSFMPDYTDAFLAGAWLVHKGIAQTAEQMEAQAASDYQETRRRAFLGLNANGEFVAGASLEVISTSKLAEAAAAAGVQEAILMDSGFSTSLIYNNKIIVTGHTAESIPSRPVPHAIVFKGELAPITDPVINEFFTKANPASGPEAIKATEDPTPRRTKRKKKKKHDDDAPPPDSAIIVQPDKSSDDKSVPDKPEPDKPNPDKQTSEKSKRKDVTPATSTDPPN